MLSTSVLSILPRELMYTTPECVGEILPCTELDDREWGQGEQAKQPIKDQRLLSGKEAQMFIHFKALNQLDLF